MKHFAATADQGFALFSPTHLVTIGLIVVLVLVLYRFRNVSAKAKRVVSVIIAIWGVADEVIYQLWRANRGIWDRNENLPWHLCTMLLLLSAIVLIWRNYRWYECIFMWVFIGPIMSILTPDLDSYGFPHYRYFQFFFTHTITVVGMLWVTWCYKLLPTFKSVWNAMKYLLAYAAVVFAFNLWWGSNYMFLNRKLPTASILDVLPAWPWYIIPEFFVLLAWWSIVVWLPVAMVQRYKYGVSWHDQIVGVWRDKDLELALHHPGGERFLEFYPECASEYPECVQQAA